MYMRIGALSKYNIALVIERLRGESPRKGGQCFDSLTAKLVIRGLEMFEYR